MNRVLKAKYARKLMAAKYFVLLTDQEAVISISGADPKSIDDRVVLMTQTAELKDFHSKMGLLVKNHQRAIARLLEPKQRSKRASRNKSVASRTTVKKIPVK